MAEPSLVDEAVPTADAAKILLPLAQAGSAHAMRELAFRLNWCRDYIDGDEASVRRNALRKFYVRNGHEPKSDAELSTIATWINEGTAMLDRCRGLDPALMATRIGWMERAARAGDTWASLYYGTNALNDMQSIDDVLVHLDEVAHRRQLARGFLQSALDRGVCDALVMLSVAHSPRGGGYRSLYWLYPADPYLSLVYAEAAVSAGIFPYVSPQTLAGVADPARRSAAASEGAALAARHCNKPR